MTPETQPLTVRVPRTRATRDPVLAGGAGGEVRDQITRPGLATGGGVECSLLAAGDGGVPATQLVGEAPQTGSKVGAGTVSVGD